MGRDQQEQTYGCHSAGQAGTAAAACPKHRAGNVDGPERGQSPIWTMLGYREPMSLSSILFPKNGLSQSAHQKVGYWWRRWGFLGSASASVLTLASHGSTQLHGPIPVSLPYLAPPLRSVTISGDKKGQDQLPR